MSNKRTGWNLTIHIKVKYNILKKEITLDNCTMKITIEIVISRREGIIITETNEIINKLKE